MYVLSARWTPDVVHCSAEGAFFGAAFILIGVPSLTPALSVYESRHAIALLAECLYSFASSAGFRAFGNPKIDSVGWEKLMVTPVFFSANFGEEAGAPASVWVMRACLVQGVQQVWVRQSCDLIRSYADGRAGCGALVLCVQAAGR